MVSNVTTFLVSFPKSYDAKAVETKWQDYWEKHKIYSFNPNSGKPIYAIDTPPPFTSGSLHMGHIYNHVWIDIVARYKRMRGCEVYLPQGFDCHGLPTELKVEREWMVDRRNKQEFTRWCEEWTRLSIKRMKEQFRAIGYSADWDYSYETMSDSYKAKVQRSLLLFYKRGLLYKEKHPVFWCPRCETTLAKAEVGYVEREGKLCHISFDVLRTKKRITIATTRPEMMGACVAIFVHPEDERYKEFIGKKARLPIYEREVPIIADEDVDPSFGTGAVYLCTYGDEQDVKWQKRLGLSAIQVVGRDGKLNENAGPYAGLSVEEARERILQDLKKLGRLERVEPLKHNVLSHTERSSCCSPLEFLPIEQWFIRVRDFRDEILEAARRMRWYPPYMLKRLEDWAESLDWDWVISRQRVFGTPLPFWICEACGHVIAAEEDELPVDPRETTKPCPKCGGIARGEEDVCDCWVDSSITPLIISKWLEDEEFFSKVYPTSLRPQGYEIIRTWAFYTIFRSLLLTNKPCFKDLLINGMVAGPDGRKMSKSLGNVIEPEEVLREYCADTLRQWAALGTLGEDYPFSWEECKHSQAFLTKLWNIARFCWTHLRDFDEEARKLGKANLGAVDKWILSKLQKLIESVTKNLDSYAFNTPLRDLRTFLWHEVADSYLEAVKHRLYKPERFTEASRRAAQYALAQILDTCLRLLAPFVPHICEELWSRIFGGLVTTTSWPEPSEQLIDEEAEKLGELLKALMREVRKLKTELGLPLGREVEELQVFCNPGLISQIELLRGDLLGFSKAKRIMIEEKRGLGGFEVLLRP